MNIVIEGIDGCGKTTVCQHLYRLLTPKYDQYNVQQVPFPDRGTHIGNLIDKFLKMPREMHGEDSAYYHQALHTVNKLERIHVLTSKNNINILSRYTQSAYVYGVLDGVDATWLNYVNSVLPQPDLCVLLDIDPLVAFNRLKERKAKDGYETMDLDWFRTCAEEYRNLWPQFDGDSAKYPDHFYVKTGGQGEHGIKQNSTTWVVINPMKYDGPATIADRICRIFDSIFRVG